MDAAVIYQIIALLFALSFHEAAHAWSADKLGDSTARDQGRITLNPIPHLDPVMSILFPALLIFAGLPAFGAAKPVPVDTRRLANPRRDHAWIAAAGPASNLLLAGVFALLARILLAEAWPVSLLPVTVLDAALQLFWWSVQINLILAAFNLIPVPPLDGSWILSNFLRGPMAAMYRSIQPYGFLILVVLIWTGALEAVLGPVLYFGRMLILL